MMPMPTLRTPTLLPLLLVAGLLAAPLLLAQAVPPPGVEAARPPTERTLQPVTAEQTRERVRKGRDCRQEVRDIREQYLIQERSVTTQYEPRLAEATGAQREALVRERDAKIASLRKDSDGAAKKLGDICRADNRATLPSSSGPIDQPNP